MFSLVVAFDENKGIGLNNSLPWHIKEDLKLFKQNTLYKNVIMGKTTFLGLPRKLVDRKMFVVTSDETFKSDDVQVINDFSTFLKEKCASEEEYIIAGGTSIYLQAYPYCSKAYVSFVKGKHECDKFFDLFQLENWNIEEEIDFELFTYRVLSRKINID